MTRAILLFTLLVGTLFAEPVLIQSKGSFYTTYKKVVRAIRSKKLKIFATIDHGKNAKKVGLRLPPTKLILFGNPRMGTKLIQKDPTIAYDLPLRLLLFRKDGKTFLLYDTDRLKAYAIDPKVIAKITKLYETIIDAATR